MTDLTFTFFEKDNRPSGSRHTTTWDGFCDWLIGYTHTGQSKSDLPLIKLATFYGDYRKDENTELVYGVEVDYDEETMTPEQARDVLQVMGVEALVYTSPSHRSEAPRWRVMVPLSKPHTPADRIALAGRLNTILGGAVALESFTLSQSYYFASVVGGHPMTCFRTTGACIDTMDWVDPTIPKYTTSAESIRKPLGEGQQAPSYAEALAALNAIDPNQLGYEEWRNAGMAFRQSTASLVTEAEAWADFEKWCDFSQWCVDNPDKAKNATPPKTMWRSASYGTQVGWSSLHWAAYNCAPSEPTVQPEQLFGGERPALPAGATALTTPPQDAATTPRVPLPDKLMFAADLAQYFEGCVSITSEGEILCADNVFRGPQSFNQHYGGKTFQLDGDGQKAPTDEPWKAATRSRVWRIPKVQFTCFRPDLPEKAIIKDALGRSYVNLYKPAAIERKQGDVSRFLNHVAKILPVASDRETLFDFMAHNLKYPGHKIFWAPLIQSAEGIGKNVFKFVMQQGVGEMYFYEPSARNLSESGSTFNAWQENKLFFLVDEIKTDEKREMVEILKPWITETRMEIQGKGSNQRMGDTPGNWLFFSNHKDAIPITKDGRRYAIFYSALQTRADILNAGFTDEYFQDLYDWLRGDGAAYVVDWLMQRPIGQGRLPVRGPDTSSKGEALAESQGWLEQMICEWVDDGLYGFRAGWVSSKMVTVELGKVRKSVASRTLSKALEALGYHKIGRVRTGTGHHDDEQPYVWHHNPTENLLSYNPSQGNPYA